MYLPACGMLMVAAVRDRWPPARRQADLILKLALAGLVVGCSLTIDLAVRADGSAAIMALRVDGQIVAH